MNFRVVMRVGVPVLYCEVSLISSAAPVQLSCVVPLSDTEKAESNDTSVIQLVICRDAPRL